MSKFYFYYTGVATQRPMKSEKASAIGHSSQPSVRITSSSAVQPLQCEVDLDVRLSHWRTTVLPPGFAFDGA